MSNYPEGVTGGEYAVAGPTSSRSEVREVRHSCGFEGEVEGELEGHRFEVWFAYSCPSCGLSDSEELDPDDFGPDPDDARERLLFD